MGGTGDYSVVYADYWDYFLKCFNILSVGGYLYSLTEAQIIYFKEWVEALYAKSSPDYMSTAISFAERHMCLPKQPRITIFSI